jgi:hypothetical protein
MPIYMKSSSDFEKYRSELAKDLVGEHKNAGAESAREKLDKEKETPEYVISKSLLGVKKALSKEDNPSSIKQVNERSHVSWEEIDIADKIPKVIKLQIDYDRINAIKNELGTPAYQLEDDVEDKLRLEVENELKKRGVESMDNLSIGYLKELVINEITNGALFDKNNLNTVIDVYGKHDQRQFDPRTQSWLNKQERINIQTKHDLSFDPDAYIKTKSLGDEKNRAKSRSTQEVWFSHPNARYLLPLYFSKGNQVIIVNPHSKRFTESVGKTNPEIQAAIEEYLRLYTEKPGYQDGITFDINSQSTWADIAEWIVDLSAGKAYRIKEDADSR